MYFIFELLGYIGLILNLYSLTLKNRSYLHLYGFIGSALLFIYAIELNSIPVILMNLVAMWINASMLEKYKL